MSYEHECTDRERARLIEHGRMVCTIVTFTDEDTSQRDEIMRVQYQMMLASADRMRLRLSEPVVSEEPSPTLGGSRYVTISAAIIGD
jgi:hypothetical protein